MIKAQKFDQANGLDYHFRERTPDAYATQFNSGEFKIGGSASLHDRSDWPTCAASRCRYLFNLFDYWGAM